MKACASCLCLGSFGTRFVCCFFISIIIIIIANGDFLDALFFNANDMEVIFLVLVLFLGVWSFWYYDVCFYSNSQYFARLNCDAFFVNRRNPKRLRLE